MARPHTNRGKTLAAFRPLPAQRSLSHALIERLTSDITAGNLAPGSRLPTEQEMIATAVSTQNRCYYCVTSHGSAVRGLSGDPILGEQIVMNYRAADLDKRQRAMLDFVVKLTVEPWTIEESDREGLRRAGFSDRDIWDIAAIAGFFNMTNRIASAIDMRPNSQYHAMGR